VNSHLKTLFNVQSIAQESGAALKELLRTFQGCLTFLKFSCVNIENWDPILVYMCSKKLPKLILSLWEQSIVWLELDSYLTARHRTLEAVDSFRSAEFLQSVLRHKSSGKIFKKKFLQHKVSSDTQRLQSVFEEKPPRSYMSTLPRLYPKKAVVFQLPCKQPSIPGLHKRSQLSHLPRSASHIAVSKQRSYYSADSIRPSKASIRLSSTHHFSPWMADVLEVLNPTNPEIAKRSILYGSATTFCG